MNPIELGGGLWLLRDPRQWILARPDHRKDRKAAWRHEGYYQYLPQALRAALERRLRSAPAQEITELLNAHEAALAELRAAISELQPRKKEPPEQDRDGPGRWSV